MSMSHRYRNFGRLKSASPDQENPGLEEIEDQKLQSFEAGYQAGWDDAIKAQSDAKGKLTEELAQNLQDMSFSYHEALAKLASSMEPVMQQVIDKLLPEMVRGALGAHILDQLKKMLSDQIENSAEIVVCEENVHTIKDLIGVNLTAPFVVVGDATVGPGEAFVRIGDTEQHIDLDGVVKGVSEAMKAFFHETQQDMSNG